MMSDDSHPSSKKDTRFKRGQSGNPKGRPPKPRRMLIPSQLRKDILRVADEVHELRTAGGVRKITKHELIILAISNGAAKGNPTSLRLWMKLIELAVDERNKSYPTARVIEMLFLDAEQPGGPRHPNSVAVLDAHLKAMKRSY